MEDVDRFVQLLKENSPEDDIVGQEDFIRQPQVSGYRAIHMTMEIDVGEGFELDVVACEVQVRTLLQDSWAELAHADVYKSEERLPRDLVGRVEDLASILAAADEIAQKIRQRLSQEFRSGGSIDLDCVSRNGLAHIFERVFGRAPSGYTVERAELMCKRHGVTELHGMSELLYDEEFRESIKNAYRDETRLGSRLGTDSLLELAAIAVATDKQNALRQLRKWARNERNEIETSWHNEILGRLPETIDEFVEELRRGRLGLEEVAEALGVAGECVICATPIIDSDSFSIAISDYYDLDETPEVLSGLIAWDGPWASWNHTDLCPYHGDVVDKDD